MVLFTFRSLDLSRNIRSSHPLGTTGEGMSGITCELTRRGGRCLPMLFGEKTSLTKRNLKLVRKQQEYLKMHVIPAIEALLPYLPAPPEVIATLPQGPSHTNLHTPMPLLYNLLSESCVFDSLRLTWTCVENSARGGGKHAKYTM